MLLEKRKTKKALLNLTCILSAVCAVAAHYLFAPWGFYRSTPELEAGLRIQTVSQAETYLGCQESDGSHKAIIDLYNSHEPLAVGYKVQYTDSWCATFVSAVAIEENLTQIIPTECSCERQIELWKQMGRWQESDFYIPQPGDLIYYDWDAEKHGDCTGWSDHVGMVVGTKWPFIHVIEGNKDDMVTYRTILVDDYRIRGFGLPNYSAILKEKPQA